jgi:uncharacterized protein (DUF427 family)
VTGYPTPLFPDDRTAPVPRRVRAMLGDRTVVDTQQALYVWEIPPYPQFYLPLESVADDVLTDTGETDSTGVGTARVHTAGSGRAWVYDEGVAAGRVRFEWNALDRWFEEDEEVFVHPRNPYSRCDAVRSSKHVTIARDGVELADSRSPVIVFETGLPPRYYLPRPHVHFEHLTPSDTQTACPYKGRTSAYWSFGRHRDLAWSYDFPTAALLPVAGLVAFYDERVDVTIDGVPQERPKTPFSRP